MSDYKEIWSTPIAEYFLENESAHLEIVNAFINPAPNPDGQTFNILDASDCKLFKSWFIEKCNEYTSQFLQYPSCSIKRSWGNIQPKGEYAHHHQHGNTDIIGVYYVNTIQGHPPLQIFDSRIPHKFNARNIIRNGKIVTENVRYVNIEPVNGKLVLFPGYLLHYVPTNMLEEPRISIAINVEVDFKVPVAED
jgi:hypothetical protein